MNNDVEIWRYIPESLDYQVSNWGRVRNIQTKQVLKFGPHNGRSRVKLHIRTRPYYFYVHRLVARVFIPGFREDDGLEFLDGDYMNCRVDNLRVKDRATGRIRRQIPKDIRVEVVETGGRYPTISAAARAVGGQATNVNRVLNGTLNTHKGFTFRFVKA